MLACVCQPAEPNIFRHSPIPLGAAPLKIPSKGAIPKVVPGRSIRITEPVVPPSSADTVSQDDNDSTESTSISVNVPLFEPNREALLSFCGERKSKEKLNEPIVWSESSSIFSKFSPVKKKCAKKLNAKHKHRKSEKHDKTNIDKSNCDKENLSLSFENIACDKKSKKTAQNYTVVKYFFTEFSLNCLRTVFNPFILILSLKILGYAVFALVNFRSLSNQVF